MRKTYWLCLGICSLIACNNPIQKAQTAVEKNADHQVHSNQAREKLLAHWAVGANLHAYPDYYGGAYVGDNGQLHIYLSEDGDAIKDKIYQLAGTKDIQFHSSAYSFSYLIEIMNYMDKYMHDSKHDKEKANIVTYALMEKDNNIKIGLLDTSPKMIAEFKRDILDSPVFQFEKAKRVELE